MLQTLRVHVYNYCMSNTNNNQRVRTYYDLADFIEDGGKHALYCEHEDGATSLIQDTNKARLMQWLKHPEDWCCYCQENMTD
jgi:hypothetical protein